jgi:hypothetical protein
MLLKSYRNILPASVAFIGGFILCVGQPEFALANDQMSYTPIDRPRPQRTQGGGSRLRLNVTSTPAQFSPSDDSSLQTLFSI